MSKLFGNHLVNALIVFATLTFPVEAGPFYIVVGTFSGEPQAQEFVESIDDLYGSAAYTFDAQREVWHVYVSETHFQQEAEKLLHRVQHESGFGYAWIFTDLKSLNESSDPNGAAAGDYTTLELYNGGSVLLGGRNNNYLAVSSNAPRPNTDVHEVLTRTVTVMARTVTGVVLSGNVSVMDQKGHALSTFKTGEAVSFSTRQPRQRVTLLCEVPGYSADTRILALDAVADSPNMKQNEDGVWEVTFVVSRVNVGEVKLLYRDIYYPDAAVFRRASRQQLDALVTLLEANPNWKIVINSHCNAGDKRTLKLTGVSYFDLADAVEKQGTDKQLTREQADAMRNYLVYKGIAKNRISVMGWGSLDMLVKTAGAAASINDRVEVEIIR